MKLLVPTRKCFSASPQSHKKLRDWGICDAQGHPGDGEHLAYGEGPFNLEESFGIYPREVLEGENSKIGYEGHNFDLIPFGAGRRIFSGLPLASRMVLVLASFLHSFEWELQDGMSCEQMDMSDEFGVTLKKAEDLKAIPTPRLPHHLY
ncbi:hypothetical protein SUGI_1163960 [Cryptomeria japonica]|nr:hypothetical protein SUGI_1163960 [Cryptomeria japonica]